MKIWKVIIEYKGKTEELTIEAPFYSDAYVNTELKYPGCIIKSITEVRQK